jgi:hypothetical protein
MIQNDPDILGLLIDHESALSRLYGTFETLFPEYRDFWGRIAIEEQEHAAHLNKLRSNPDVNRWLLKSRLKPQAISLSIEYVNSIITKAGGRDFSLLNALSYAKDLENALIEKIFINMDYPTSAEIDSIISVLVLETTRHRKIISETLEANR